MSDTTPTKLTPAARTFIDRALAISDDAAETGFMARALVQATLPHRKVEGNEFTRTNGHYTLSILAPAAVGLPYGSVPRLLLAWVTTEAARTGSREIELGDTMAAFMRQLGLKPTGGAKGDITRLKDQARRLFRSMISLTYDDGRVDADVGFRLADRTTFWWHAREPEQGNLWQSSITLTEAFFREITEHLVPVNMDTLRELKRSPLAIDIYCWLTYRCFTAKRAATIPWPALSSQFGADYSELRFFKRAFLAELRKVHTHYAAAKFDITDAGLIVKPGRPHVAAKTGT
jgi:hypothetical protein